MEQSSIRKCLFCNLDIINKRNKFCNKSCAASFNNKIPKRKTFNTKKCDCGNEKDYYSKRCHSCKIKLSLDIQLNRTVEDVLLTTKDIRTKYTVIRNLAHRLLEQYNIKKECKICGFDICLDVCHIKPVSSFNITSKIKDINNLENVIYLCPNHHRMLDRGLIQIPIRALCS